MSVAAAVVHSTLATPGPPGAAPPVAVTWASARLTDRRRIAALLAGAGLLSLLERAGWCLAAGWKRAGLSVAGELVVVPAGVVPGHLGRPPHELLGELLLRLFGAAAGAEAGDGAGDEALGVHAPPVDSAAWTGVEGGGEVVPGSGGLAGRGVARRAARAVFASWWQPLVPPSADEAVAHILREASFLWEPAYAAARQALAGEIRDDHGAVVLWVAGPRASRARLLSGCTAAPALAARLASSAARHLWEGGGERPSGVVDAAVPKLPAGVAVAASPRGGVDPGVVAVAGADGLPGRRRALLVDGETRLVGSEARDVEAAAAFLQRGRFDAALTNLATCRSPTARLLKARCQMLLGRLGAARATLRRLEGLPLSAAEAIAAADTAIRVFANSGEPGAVQRWVAKALSGPATAADLAAAQLLAAEAAWDRQDPPAMDRHLDAAREALGLPASEPITTATTPLAIPRGAHLAVEPGLPVAAAATPSAVSARLLLRWHRALALRAMAAADGAAVVRHLGAALGRSRRSMARHEAGGVWNDLGIGRVQTGDLEGAERAFLHAQRLLEACDGPRRTTLALLNLAEVRLRRGRVAGVREILARSTAENRRGGNVRGLSQDTELWARLELVLGRPATTETLCRRAMERMDQGRSPWRRQILGLLRARALGWLARPAEAAAELLSVTPEALAEIEAEERPALWALAGRHGRAAECAAGLPSPVGEMWRAVLGDGGTLPFVSATAWEALGTLEPYRAARLVFDIERLMPRSPLVPEAWRHRAITTLRQVGATEMAHWLEARAGDPWSALAAYAGRPVGDLDAIGALLRDAARQPPALPASPAESSITSAAPSPAIDSAPAGDFVYTPPRLSWIPAGELREPAADVRTDDSAAVVLAVDLPGGRFEVRCQAADPVLTACFALAARDLALSTAGEATTSSTPSAPASPAAPSSFSSFSSLAPLASSTPRRARATTLIGSSPALVATVARLGRLAAVDIPVLIRGESGTGKELAARELHRTGGRAGRPFLAVNCAAFAEALLLSDLFGHARGAFTGADRERVGVFEAAGGGVVLLDEIGDLPLAAQGMLLRVLQEGEVRRLGESTARRVDVRVLAATHRDLEQAVSAGTFRRDLFYRLKVGAIELPPLRERGDDVLELADHFLTLHGARNAAAPRLSTAAREALRRHLWPGNVRELENVLRLAVALAAGGQVEAEHLELPASAAAVDGAGSYHQQIEAFRRRLVSGAIRAAGGQHAEAARRLGISRQALSYLVRQLGLR